MTILDTDILSVLEWQSSPAAQRVLSRIAKEPPTEVGTSVISYEEQIRGWMRLIAREKEALGQIQAYARLQKQLKLFCTIPMFGYDELAATKFQSFKKQKLRIGTPDLKIAAIALALNARLVSRNLQDFQQIPGLQVEDWTKE